MIFDIHKKHLKLEKFLDVTATLSYGVTLYCNWATLKNLSLKL